MGFRAPWTPIPCPPGGLKSHSLYSQKVQRSLNPISYRFPEDSNPIPAFSRVLKSHSCLFQGAQIPFSALLGDSNPIPCPSGARIPFLPFLRGTNPIPCLPLRLKYHSLLFPGDSNPPPCPPLGFKSHSLFFPGDSDPIPCPPGVLSVPCPCLPPVRIGVTATPVPCPAVPSTGFGVSLRCHRGHDGSQKLWDAGKPQGHPPPPHHLKGSPARPPPR